MENTVLNCAREDSLGIIDMGLQVRGAAMGKSRAAYVMQTSEEGALGSSYLRVEEGNNDGARAWGKVGRGTEPLGSGHWLDARLRQLDS